MNHCDDDGDFYLRDKIVVSDCSSKSGECPFHRKYEFHIQLQIVISQLIIR